jgi:hypothetical protein
VCVAGTQSSVGRMSSVTSREVRSLIVLRLDFIICPAGARVSIILVCTTFHHSRQTYQLSSVRRRIPSPGPTGPCLASFTNSQGMMSYRLAKAIGRSRL